jgi:hypothetical protein
MKPLCLFTKRVLDLVKVQYTCSAGWVATPPNGVLELRCQQNTKENLWQE